MTGIIFLLGCVCRASSHLETKNENYFLQDLLKPMTTRETVMFNLFEPSHWDYTTATERLITLSFMPYLRNLKCREVDKDGVMQDLIDLSLSEEILNEFK